MGGFAIERCQKDISGYAGRRTRQHKEACKACHAVRLWKLGSENATLITRAKTMQQNATSSNSAIKSTAGETATKCTKYMFIPLVLDMLPQLAWWIMYKRYSISRSNLNGHDRPCFQHLRHSPQALAAANISESWAWQPYTASPVTTDRIAIKRKGIFMAYPSIPGNQPHDENIVKSCTFNLPSSAEIRPNESCGLPNVCNTTNRPVGVIKPRNAWKT